MRPLLVRNAVEFSSQSVESLASCHERRLVPSGQFQLARRILLDLDGVLQGVCLLHIFRAIRIAERAEEHHHVPRTHIVDGQSHFTRTVF
jgi:hypothetical protein